jgi:hypothetical protein
MYYKKELLNPEKHPLMPEDYPWIISDVKFDEDFIKIEQEALTELLATDLTPFHTEMALKQLKESLEKKRVFGVGMSELMCVEVGARNMTLISEGFQVNIPQVLTSFAPIKMLLETGAIETAKGAILQMKAYYPPYDDIMQAGIDMIDNFITLGE